MKPSGLACFVLLFSWFVLEPAIVHGAPVPPQVVNLRVAQRPGTMFVDIYYDLIDPDSEQVWVGVELSADAGVSYNIPANNLTGDIGIVGPGRDKHIVWNAWNDWPGNYTTRGRVKITVNDTKNAVFLPPFSAPRANLVWIPPGTFTMGSPNNEQDRYSDEGPQTRVYLSRGFFMGKYEVTQAEYQDIMGSNPSNFKGDVNRPVEMVSWTEATDYCRRLTDRERAAGRLPAGYEYRLPTEAQWEYAARAGTTTRFSFGDDPGYTELGKYAWYSANSGSTTHMVGTKLPNFWGLYDMSGNVWEWCADWYESYPGGSRTDPSGPGSGSIRVSRGGSWGGGGRFCRSADRVSHDPAFRRNNLGFRAALVPVP